MDADEYVKKAKYQLQQLVATLNDAQLSGIIISFAINNVDGQFKLTTLTVQSVPKSVL